MSRTSCVSGISACMTQISISGIPVHTACDFCTAYRCIPCPSCGSHIIFAVCTISAVISVRTCIPAIAFIDIGSVICVSFVCIASVRIISVCVVFIRIRSIICSAGALTASIAASGSSGAVYAGLSVPAALVIPDGPAFFTAFSGRIS